MKIVRYGMLVVATSMVSVFCATSDGGLKSLHVFSVPGLKGLGSGDDAQKYIRDLLSDDSVDAASLNITSVETPRFDPDLGQNACLKFLQQAVDARRQQDDYAALTHLIHGISQGASTTLNFIAHSDRRDDIKGVILEAPFASGTSAIQHTVDKRGGRFACVAQWWGSYYWGPYVARAKFWRYWPFGKQPITGLENIPRDMVIILTHAKDDTQTRYTDTCALYHGLRKQDHKNVYFIPQEGVRHKHILKDPKHKKAVRAILRHHGLLPTSAAEGEDMSVDDLRSEYQPDHVPFQEHYDDLMTKEKNHKMIGRVLKTAAIPTTCLTAACVAAYSFLKLRK